MSHHIYTTKAFIIESFTSGEANKSYLAFTEELGMIRATAQGVRLLKSKLRFSLQDFSVTSISVVRGKDIWRITNAKAISNLFEEYRSNPEMIRVVAQIFYLLKRLMPGEEKHEKLFNFIADAFSFIHTSSKTREEIISFECIVVLNILFELGYLAKNSELQHFVEPVWSQELLQALVPYRKIAYQAINMSLRETQL